MSAVEVEIANEPADGTADDRADDRADKRPGGGRSKKKDAGTSSDRTSSAPSANAADAQVEREVTKRELIRSVSNILIVILYMVFTLLRDRDAGVVVVDADDADDWEG